MNLWSNVCCFTFQKGLYFSAIWLVTYNSSWNLCSGNNDSVWDWYHSRNFRENQSSWKILCRPEWTVDFITVKISGAKISPASKSRCTLLLSIDFRKISFNEIVDSWNEVAKLQAYESIGASTYSSITNTQKLRRECSPVFVTTHISSHVCCQVKFLNMPP